MGFRPDLNVGAVLRTRVRVARYGEDVIANGGAVFEFVAGKWIEVVKVAGVLASRRSLRYVVERSKIFLSIAGKNIRVRLVAASRDVSRGVDDVRGKPGNVRLRAPTHSVPDGQ